MPRLSLRVRNRARRVVKDRPKLRRLRTILLDLTEVDVLLSVRENLFLNVLERVANDTATEEEVFVVRTATFSTWRRRNANFVTFMCRLPTEVLVAFQARGGAGVVVIGTWDVEGNQVGPLRKADYRNVQPLVRTYPGGVRGPGGTREPTGARQGPQWDSSRERSLA